jgi:3-methyladenine DNA glycosylase AlkD
MTYAAEVLVRIRDRFEPARDPARAAPMAAYMRGKFPFLGIPAPEQSRLLRSALAGTEKPSEGDLAELAGHLWQLPEREYQYAACSIAARHVGVCGPGFITTARTLITTKSWWDTVDSLAKNVAGGLVARHAELADTMDAWFKSEDIWLVRTAILHQLGFKAHTDRDRLFRYSLGRAHDREFFIRKAIGWALREYSKVDGEGVRAFVAAHPELSPLSRREALLWLEGGRRKQVAKSGT